MSDAPSSPSDTAPEDARAVEHERALLAATAAGDGAAFEELVRLFEGRVLSLCQRLLGNREEARDAAQDVFLKVYEKAGSYTPRGRVYTWIYRIATNRCLNLVRRRKVVRFLGFGEVGGERDDFAPPLFHPADDAPSPAHRAESRARWAVARRALDALPAQQRAALVLVRLEGLSYAETAEVLGTSVSAVTSLVFRAMRGLEALVGEGADP